MQSIEATPKSKVLPEFKSKNITKAFGPKNATLQDINKPKSESESLVMLESFRSTFVDYCESMAEVPAYLLTPESLREIVQLAAREGDMSSLRKILEIKPKNVDLVNVLSGKRPFWAPIHEAANKGHVEVVELFIRKFNANVNLRTRSGATALHLACQNGHK